MHEAANERLVHAGIAQSAAVSMTVSMRRRAQPFAHREPNPLTGSGMRLVVLRERVYRANRLPVQVDEGKGMVTLDACDLFEITGPEMQEPFAILRQEPVRLLVVRRIVGAAFPAGMTAIHQFCSRGKTELMGKVFRSVSFMYLSPLIAPIGRRGTVGWVVDEDLCLE